MSRTCELPEDVRAAFLRRVKSTLLDHYVGDRCKLEPWSDFRASLVSIHSGNLGVDCRKALRKLAKLAEAGAIIEKSRYRNGIGPRSFTLPREQLDELAAQAMREHKAAGYVLGVMMPKIVVPA